MKAKSDKTDTIKKEFLEALLDEKICGNVMAAAKYIKRNRQYMYVLKGEDPLFSKNWELNVSMGRKLGIEIAEFGLMGNIKDGNVTAQIFYLKSHLPEIYGEKLRVGGQPDGSGTIEHTISVSPELMKQIDEIAVLLKAYKDGRSNQ